MKTTKKALSFILIAFMVLTMLPHTARASEVICQIGVVEYVDFGTALAEAKDGETITLLTDINYSDGIVVNGQTITFDLDGHTLNVSKYGGHGLEVGGGGELILIEGGGQFNVKSIGDYHGVYAHDGGQAAVTSAKASPDASSAAACAEGASSTVWVKGNAISGDGYVGDGAYAVDGGAVFVAGDASGFRGARASGATEGGVSSRVEVTGNAIGVIFGATAENGGTVIVGGAASGSYGARARDDGSLVQVSGDSIGSERYGADAMNGGTVTVGGNAQGGTTGARASGATAEGVSSRVEVTGNAIGSITGGEPDDTYCGAHAIDGGVVIVGGIAQGFTIGAYAEGAAEYGVGSRVEVTGMAMGSVGAYAFEGGYVEIGGMEGFAVAGFEIAIKAEGPDSTVFAASNVVIPLVGSTENVCVVATDGGTATIDGDIINMAGGAYIRLGDIEKTAEEGFLVGDYMVYTDASNTVRAKINGVCMIGVTSYDTLEEALNEVESGETIKLLKDIDYTVDLPDRPGIVITDTNITFDMNGHTLNVISSAGHALEVDSGGVVNLIENGGEFNVTSSAAAGHGVYAHSGGQAKVTNATATGLGSAAVHAEGTDEGGNPSRVEATGDVSSSQHYVMWAADGADIIADGNAEGLGGLVAWGGGSSIVIAGDVTSSAEGLQASSGGSIEVDGDVRVSGNFTFGAATNGSGSTVSIGGDMTVTGTKAVGVYSVDGGLASIGGDVTSSGTEAMGVFAADGGLAVIDGALIAPEEAYIVLLISPEDPEEEAVPVVQAAADGVPATAPYEGYLVYTDEVSFVYVRILANITASAGPGGSISPSGTITVGAGGDQTFTITPDSNYSIATVTVDGNDIGAVATYTFNDVTGGNHTIRAIFNPKSDGSRPSYISRTLADNATGITVSGDRIHRMARLTVSPLKLHPVDTCAACEAICKAQEHDQLIVGCDISLTPAATGELTISISVGSQHNDRTVTILHCVNGRLETITATVVNGKATFTVTSLSPFAVTTGLHVPETTVTSPPKTGDAATPIGCVMLGLAAMCAGLLIMKLRKV